MIVDSAKPREVWGEVNIQMSKLPEEERNDFAKSVLAKNGYSLITITETGAWVAICPFLFTIAIIQGHMDDLTTYSNRWCFSSYDKAVEALNDWVVANLEGEPTGWHRHPLTGRRRTEGDPATEYINR